jgi:hypothetical protein
MEEMIKQGKMLLGAPFIFRKNSIVAQTRRMAPDLLVKKKSQGGGCRLKYRPFHAIFILLSIKFFKVEQ